MEAEERGWARPMTFRHFFISRSDDLMVLHKYTEIQISRSTAMQKGFVTILSENKHNAFIHYVHLNNTIILVLLGGHNTAFKINAILNGSADFCWWTS